MALTVRVGALYLRTKLGEKTGLSKTQVSVTFHWSPFVRYSIYDWRRVTFVHSSNQMKSDRKFFLLFKMYSSSQDTTARQPSVFLTGIHRLVLITYSSLHYKGDRKQLFGCYSDVMCR